MPSKPKPQRFRFHSASERTAVPDGGHDEWTAAKLEGLAGWAMLTNGGGRGGAGISAVKYDRAGYEARVVSGEHAADGKPQIVFLLSWPTGSMTLINPTVSLTRNLMAAVGYPGECLDGVAGGSDAIQD